jgi:TMEM175 potassium channel family protein
VTEDDNAASLPGTQPPNEPAGTAGRDASARPRGGQRHGPGGHRNPAPFGFARSGFIEYDRVLFFSDAVFAIAITLLVIELKVPRSSRPHEAIPGHPQKVIPGDFGIDKAGLISFGISFAVIGLFWLGHHGIFRYIVALDRPLIRLNLLFLGTIALLPYPTALLNITADQHAANVVFYAICNGAAGLGECLIWLYATRPGSALAAPSAAPIRLRYGLRIARVPVVFVISIPVALVAPQDAPYVCILIFILGFVIDRFVPEPDEPDPAGDQIPD